MLKKLLKQSLLLAALVGGSQFASAQFTYTFAADTEGFGTGVYAAGAAPNEGLFDLTTTTNNTVITIPAVASAVVPNADVNKTIRLVYKKGAGGPNTFRVKSNVNGTNGNVNFDLVDTAGSFLVANFDLSAPDSGVTTWGVDPAVDHSINNVQFRGGQGNVQIDTFALLAGTTLSTIAFNTAIEGLVITSENGNVSTNKGVITGVYDLAGQTVGTSGLTTGIYIVQVEEGSKSATVKIAL